MSARVVVGLQFGDEGKGKIVDYLAREAGLVIRFNGGANAGHTVENDSGIFKLHLVPSGIFNPGVWCFLGNGAVVDPEALIQELAGLKAAGVDTRFFRVSSRAHVVMPWHKLADAASEAAKGKAAIGTTGRGIGPCYTDKAARVGIRMCELLDRDTLLQKAGEIWDARCGVAASTAGPFQPASDKSQFGADIRRWCAELRPYVADTDMIARKANQDGVNILLEAAQGTMIDLEFGTYPYVTSSYATSAGACIGSGLPPTAIKEIVGVAKAYTTRVGNGPMPTELLDATGERLRQAGHEFGTTTGRPRRCGWFDAPLVKYAAEVNGATSIVLTKLDILSALPELHLATAHEFRGAKRGEPFGPTEPFDEYRPVYETMPGWSVPIDGVTSWDLLPDQAKRYVERIETLVGVHIGAVATGPNRDAILKR